MNGKKRSGAKRAAPTSMPSPPAAFVTVSTPPPAAAALEEIALEGMTLRLSGEAEERVLAGRDGTTRMILSSAVRAYVYGEAVDMRKSIDGRSQIVAAAMGMNPLSSTGRGRAHRTAG
ncbi:hypothetical protein [Piscinibacter sp. XHJ-5]|uniref:hypothetical protein n=1 Tax=Piscinibacter sp. XHJ-5 TaxID=3037797 RepID=UPI0024528DB9|nr:hypothetical protein [Piscinibacter sp. XHJ-5]